MSTPTATWCRCRASSAPTRAAVELGLGRVSRFGPNTISYESYPNAAGTEIINYRIADRFGATTQGFIRVGVVPPGDPQPPVAVEDSVTAAPGRVVTIPIPPTT